MATELPPDDETLLQCAKDPNLDMPGVVVVVVVVIAEARSIEGITPARASARQGAHGSQSDMSLI